MDANRPVSGAVLTGSSCLRLQPSELKESRNAVDAMANLTKIVGLKDKKKERVGVDKQNSQVIELWVAAARAGSVV